MAPVMTKAAATTILRAGRRDEWNRFRAQHPGQAFDLAGEDLHDVRLHSNNVEDGCDLSDCRLDGANLCGANLVRANLARASLVGADLRGVDLGFARLDGADLSDARLARADLKVTSMTGTKLEPTSLSCVLCNQEAAVRFTGSSYELTCAACGRYGMSAEHLLAELRQTGSSVVAYCRTTNWTEPLGYPRFVRACRDLGCAVRIEACPFCASWACRSTDPRGVQWLCRVCGPFKVPVETGWLEGVAPRVRQKVTWYVRQVFDARQLGGEPTTPVALDARRVTLISEELGEPSDPLACVRRLLEWIRARSLTDGSYLEILDVDYALAQASSPRGLAYAVEQARALGWIEDGPHESSTHRLTLAGWKQALEWQRTAPDRRQVFVAMSFDPSFDEAWRAMAAGVRDAGLEPLRVDELQHNEKICDRLLAEIRRSRLVIADCSRGTGNVYFEAGFAMGLGLPVIWTCRREGVERLQFDTRQYPYILWDDPVELRERIHDRLAAMLPAGG